MADVTRRAFLAVTAGISCGLAAGAPVLTRVEKPDLGDSRVAPTETRFAGDCDFSVITTIRDAGTGAGSHEKSCRNPPTLSAPVDPYGK